MKIHPVVFRHGRRLGDNRQCVYRQHIVAELIVQAGAHLVQHKIGIDPLHAAEKRHAPGAVVGEEIFKPRSPVRRNRHLHTGSRRKAQSPQERLFDRAGGKLRQRLPIVGPGESAGHVE